MGISFIEKLQMAQTFFKYQHNPEKLAREYFKNPSKWEALKQEYPNWEREANARYPKLRIELRKLGVPV